jgi:hypothetical protein
VYKHSIVSVAPRRHPSSLMPLPAEGAPQEAGVPVTPPGEAGPSPAPVGVTASPEGEAPPPTPEPGPDE